MTPAEWNVMRTVWRLPEREVTVREVCEVLESEASTAGEEPLAYSTVKTVMERLVEKGHLSARKRSNVGFFRALTDPDEAGHTTVHDLVERTFGGLATPLVNYLTGGARLTEEDIARLEEFVAHRKRRRKRRG